MNGEGTGSVGWKRKVVDELVDYYFNFVYLAFFLVAFTWYRRLILEEYAIQYLGYWVPLVEAAVLAKVIMVGDVLRLGRGLERAPLLLRTFYRTLMFSVWVAVFGVLEHAAGGLLHGKGLTGGLAELADKGRYELLAKCVVIFGAFVPFFAFKELEKVLGKDRLRALFWKRAGPASDPSSQGTGGESRS